MASIIRPRLNDYHNIPLVQEEVDFAIPFLDEDIPLYVDPFLLWKSPSQQDNGLHSLITDNFNYLGWLSQKGRLDDATKILISISECNAVGLGNSKTKEGKRIGEKLALLMLDTFSSIPQISTSGYAHFEEIQLLVDKISKDRISDIACNFMTSFLIDYTIEQSEKHNIPIEKVTLNNVYNARDKKFQEETTYLPINPNTNQPILYVPKRWLRYIPWINPDDYFCNYYASEVDQSIEKLDRVKLLSFNRHNYDVVQTYTKIKERNFEDCKNDPLFTQIPVTSAKRKLSTIIKLPTGKIDNADMKYEDTLCPLLASMLYPHLDFAQEQSRTESGVLIRDLIFYNNKSIDLLQDIYDTYDSRQIVFELKNVKELTRDHIFQLNRYLNDNLGKFGIIFTRNPPPKRIFNSTIDLWSGQRRCILILDDEDLKIMAQVFESEQRLPIEVINKKYVEFMRACPS